LFLQKEKTSVVNIVDHQRKNLSAVLLTPVNNLTLVSWTSVNNLSVVTLTLAITFFSGVVDTNQKQPKSLKFIARPPENCSPVSMTPPMNKINWAVLSILACLHRKMKNKQKFNL
jgi:hypothetical protein